MSGQIYGSVTNDKSKGLSGATVIAKSSSTTGTKTTDSVGEFSFNSLPNGTYTVTASLSGYDDVSFTVTLDDGNAYECDFTMTASSSSSGSEPKCEEDGTCIVIDSGA